MIRDASRGAPLLRSDTARIYETGDRLIVFDDGGEGLSLTGDSADLARAVLEALEQPRSLDEVLEHLADLTGGPIEHPKVVDELVEVLLSAGAVGWVDPSSQPRTRPCFAPHQPVRVVLGLSGAVATMSSPMLVQALQREGFHVRVVATDNALRFVSVEALEALTHHEVIHSLWPAGGRDHVPHIDMAQWADAVLICPASATTLSRLATADHDCVVAATALATSAPVMVVPSMNPAMYESPGVQRNLQTLRQDGMCIVHPSRGVEMAEAPDARTPLRGSAPPASVVVQLLTGMLRDRAAGRDDEDRRRPRDAADWDTVYRGRHAAPLPWHTTQVDGDMAAAVARLAPCAGGLLDIGTGLGTLAVEFAGRGYRVVATDLSALALDEAHRAAPDAPVVWLQDDISDTHLRGRFDAALDRGCFHVLADPQCSRYVQTLARLLGPGGVLVLKGLVGEVARARGARDCSDAEIQRWFGSEFAVEQGAQSGLTGGDETLPARLFVLRRRG